MKHVGYYEGVLQLRNPSKELINFVSSQIKKKENVSIAKEIELKTGIDIYLTSKRFLRSLGNRIKRNFKGTLKTSASHFSRDRQTSKPIYRSTILFKQD